MPRGAPSPLFYLRHFFAWFLTLVPRSLLLNSTETIATQAVADGESSVALCHGVASGGLGPKERCHSVPRCGVKKRIDRGPREQCLGHRVALKKKWMIGRGPRERCRSMPRGGVKEEKRKKNMIGSGPRESCLSFPRFGINNTLQSRKERNSKGVWERAESRSLCCFK